MAIRSCPLLRDAFIEDALFQQFLAVPRPRCDLGSMWTFVLLTEHEIRNREGGNSRTRRWRHVHGRCATMSKSLTPCWCAKGVKHKASQLSSPLVGQSVSLLARVYAPCHSHWCCREVALRSVQGSQHRAITEQVESGRFNMPVMQTSRKHLETIIALLRSAAKC